MKNIPHLHVHSYYSLLDGVPSPEAYLKRCEELDIPAIAMTDHGNCGSWAQFSIESKKYKTKAILGLEAYVTDSVKKVNFVRKRMAEEKNVEEKKKYGEWLKNIDQPFMLFCLRKIRQGIIILFLLIIMLGLMVFIIPAGLISIILRSTGKALSVLVLASLGLLVNCSLVVRRKEQ